MRSHGRSFRGLFLAMSAVCVLAALPAMSASGPDSGGDRTAPTGLAFIFDKGSYPVPAAPAGAVAAGSVSRLSVRLYGGYGRIGAGDVNDASAGFFDLLEFYAATTGGTSTGGYGPLHGGYSFGADVIYQITPNVGVGFGAGFMRNSRLSRGTFTISGEEGVATVRPTLSAIPIQLGVFFAFPVAGKVDLTANVGGAYYAGLKFDSVQRLEYSPADWVEFLIGTGRASSANLGFHGSLGFEYKLTPKTAFFVEALGRYADLKNFDTAWRIMNDGGGSSNTQEGKLYIRETTGPVLAFTDFTVREIPPLDDIDTTFREPKFDLSGFSLQAGFRVRF